MKSKQILFPSLLLSLMSDFVPSYATAVETAAFSDLWKRIEAHSPSLEAARQDEREAALATAQAGRHLLPQVSLEGRAYHTNDPAMSFASTLAQRRIEAADFSPAQLNEPTAKLYEKLTLGVRVPLYAGGGPSSRLSAAKFYLESRILERQSARNAEYIRAAVDYASVALFADARRKVARLATLVQSTLSKYQLGSRANPVGYSGLLGLRTLRNRIEGVELQFSSKEKAAREDLSAMTGGLSAIWVPDEGESFELFEFLREYLSPTMQKEQALQVKALAKAGEAKDRAADAERAVSLPHFGLFGEGSLNAGERASVTSYAAGAYLRWELFSPGSYGSSDRSKAGAQALHARAELAERDLTVLRLSAQEGQGSLSKSIVLMNESVRLLADQTETARTLFQNGSINALQLVEVYNRRLDLIEAITTAQNEYLKLRQAELTTASTDITGGSHE